MRTSRYLLSTLKETPTDAEIISHQLMLRAGMIRRVAAGIYNWLPLGLRVLRKVENIVREEMDKAGAQEVLMPAVQPAELWQESGRWNDYGPELLRFNDRHQREFCFGPTHEEVVTTLVKNEIRSYRQLPVNFYQIQTKFRDEIRPRFGVMRGREFLMKDAYSFDIDAAGLQATYELMYTTYARIFERLGLDTRAVKADTGTIGGDTSHEFHVLADSGEDEIAICSQCSFAANVEMVPAPEVRIQRPAACAEMKTVNTPNMHTIEELSKGLNIDASQTVKTLIVKGADGLVALVLRGDHELSSVKAEKQPEVKVPIEFATADEIGTALKCDPGSIGPVGLDLPVIVDTSASVLADFVCGANKNGKHFAGVNWGRDCTEPKVCDLRKVTAGDPCPQSNDPLLIRRGIEVGHIFQLGTKYSKAFKATFLDENGQSVIMSMGCYGIGVSRIVASAIEQHNDGAGINWPESIAPFEVCLVPIGFKKSSLVQDTCDSLYLQLQQAGFDVLLDDRDERPGVMFADMELIGIPHRLVVGERSLKDRKIEYVSRRSGERLDIPLESLVETLITLRQSSI